jgi:predicted aspartyl protease
MLRFREVAMGSIVTTVSIVNAAAPARHVHDDGLIDTGSWGLSVPASWKERLGPLQLVQRIELVTADQRVIIAEVGGPVIVQIATFRPISTEVVLTPMDAEHRGHRILIGYTILAQAGIVVDVVHQRLTAVPYYDLRAQVPRSPRAMTFSSRIGFTPSKIGSTSASTTWREIGNSSA